MVNTKEMIRKICMIGDPAVGKTSLVKRYVLDIFDDEYISSIGMKVTKKHVALDDDSLGMTLMIWDILGSKTQRFDSVYYKGVKGAIMVTDVTRKGTMDNLPKWIKGLYDVAGKVPLVFLTNKIDLGGYRFEFEDKMLKYAEGFDTDFMFTSAKTGENVEKAFQNIAKKIALESQEE